MNKNTILKINKFIFWISVLALFVIVFLFDLQSSYGPGTSLVQIITSAFYKNVLGITILVIAMVSGIVDLISKAIKIKHHA